METNRAKFNNIEAFVSVTVSGRRTLARYPIDSDGHTIIFSSGITCTFSLHDSMCITARFECHFLLHGYISQVDSCPLLWQFVFHLFFKLRGSSGDKFAIENAYLDNLSKLLYINVKGST